jgi:hypothetical protein
MSTIHAPQRISAVPAALQHPTLTDRTVRPTILDRLTMRIAVRLLLWSTRPGPSREQLEARRRADEQRTELLRQADALRAWAPFR